MSEVSLTLNRQLRELGREFPSRLALAGRFFDKQGRLFLLEALQVIGEALAWELAETVEVEEIALQLVGDDSKEALSRLAPTYRGGAVIALSIGSHSCYLLLQQDFAARLIHLALLGIPLPRLYSDLKSSALGYLIAELIVRYEALQRVPIMVRAVDLFSSSGKWARFEEQLATNICGLEVRAGMCVGDCSYSLGFLVSDSLLKWLEPILNRGLIETMRDNRFHD